MPRPPVAEPFYAAVGAQLRSAREARGMTLVQLAARLGRTYVNISQLERGRQRIHFHLVREWAAFVGVDLLELADCMTHVSANIEPIYEIFGARLRKARLALGLSLPDVAKRLSQPRTPPSLSNIELGQQRIPLHLAAELAAIVGADLTELTRPSSKRERWEALGRAEREP